MRRLPKRGRLWREEREEVARIEGFGSGDPRGLRRVKIADPLGDRPAREAAAPKAEAMRRASASTGAARGFMTILTLALDLEKFASNHRQDEGPGGSRPAHDLTIPALDMWT